MRQAEFPQEQEREKAHLADFHSLFRGLMDNAEVTKPLPRGLSCLFKQKLSRFCVIFLTF